ncbi:sirohydrochlorin cobaltochelatase [Schwartzia succinivorans]|jgi:sirohydrochlorin cobaltochelatase|uniref:Sirohydrochlorin cobaltochelatase n=1 Tax=Schwartzia succinivorans DSM 10502 TaxID=1123243 RepID=A0A1M5A6A9_9FIRM|nr:sirohydrochlorin cobaltochelatase [Schwartzia succinivorans]SHF25684.1 sirohydrochlorin cobaltochelatase [Schwartzia succinivorans DSM 10502]
MTTYKLNSAVKAPTPSLLRASQIGELSYINSELQHLDDKDAILVMSFGTTFKGTRKATIQATVDQIQSAHPDTKVALAFTSHIIIDRVKANEGMQIPIPEEALDQLAAEGYTRVALTTLDILPGMEYAYNTAVFDHYKDKFKKITMGTPLLYWMGQEDQRDDFEQFVEALKTQLPDNKDDEAVLLMAHGTPHPSNAFYTMIQTRIDAAGIKNVYMYTVEGWPTLADIIPRLKRDGIKHVTLMPAMMVAGDHVTNDMAGDDPDSHKSQLEAEGFTVSTYIHGLGENAAIRQIFVDRADEAYNLLTSNE